MRWSLLAFALCTLAASEVRAQDLKEMLDKGEVVLVEHDSKGKFKQATAVIHIERPVEEVWAIATNLGDFKNVMPKVVKSDARKLKENQVEMDLEIEVPGSNTEYTFRYDIDPVAKTIKGRWVKGDLKNSSCQWRLVPYNGGTLLYYTVSTKNFSGLAENLDDEQQTITVGVNVGAALATTRAVKKRAESAASGTQAAAK